MFWMPEKPMIKMASGVKLYTPRQNTGKYTEAQVAYIAECAQDCKWGPDNGKWPRASKVLVNDGFEIGDSLGLDIWEMYKDLPEFSELKAEAEALDAKVMTGILSESSVQGLVD